MPKEPVRCCKCNVELSWRELQGQQCFICRRLEAEKNGFVIPDTIQYDDRDYEN